MEYIKCGELTLPVLGLGTYSMQGAQLQEAISVAIESGYTLFDTAQKYNNEKQIGRITIGTQAIIQSKVSSRTLSGSMRCFWLNRKSVQKAYNISNERIGNFNLAIFLLHSYFADSAKYLKRLSEIKGLKAFGICNLSLHQLKILIEKNSVKPMIVQAEIHPYHSNKDLIKYCIENEIVIEARSPFAHGDALHEWESNEKLMRIAKKYNKSICQIILRWIIQQGVIAIFRSGNNNHIMENIDIFDFCLNNEEMTVIDSMNKNLSYGYISNR